MSSDDIASRLNISKRTVRLCVSKYNDAGIDAALFDDERSGRPVEISDDAKSWLINFACQRPIDLGYAQELWTLANLHRHVQKPSQEASFPRLRRINS